MIHSLRYYICYVLLCLLHQQLQLASSLTIIIDGATTNEWNTRDEYRRLAGANPSGAEQQLELQLQPQSRPLGDPPRVADGSATADLEPPARLTELEQPDQDGSGSGSSLEGELERRATLELALEMLERERQREGKGLQVAKPLSIRPRNRHQQHHIISSNGAQQPTRTIADLVAVSDQDLVEDSISPRLPASTSISSPISLSRSFAGDRYARESQPEHYCGHKLTEILDLVCHGRFHEPTVVEPIIKSRRSADSNNARQQQDYERQENDGEENSSNINLSSPIITTSSSQQSKLKNPNDNKNIILGRPKRKDKLRLRRGVVSECCVNACTIDTIRTYCQKKDE